MNIKTKLASALVILALVPIVAIACGGGATTILTPEPVPTGAEINLNTYSFGDDERLIIPELGEFVHAVLLNSTLHFENNVFPSRYSRQDLLNAIEERQRIIAANAFASALTLNQWRERFIEENRTLPLGAEIRIRPAVVDGIYFSTEELMILLENRDNAVQYLSAVQLYLDNLVFAFRLLDEIVIGSN